MVQYVYELCSKATTLDELVVATDSEKIRSALSDFGTPVVMTSDQHPTGTDRVAEASLQYPTAEIIVNIQGDEPLLDIRYIDTVIRTLQTSDNVDVVNLCAPITDPKELIDTNTIKVVVGADGNAVYLSRSPVPYPKDRMRANHLRQVCVYGYRPTALQQFADTPPPDTEVTEGVELLRFIDSGIKVKFIEVESGSFSVDSPEDLRRANHELSQRSSTS